MKKFIFIYMLYAKKIIFYFIYEVIILKRLKRIAVNLDELIKYAYDNFNTKNFIDYYFTKGDYENNNKKNNKADILNAIEEFIPQIDLKNENLWRYKKEIAGYIDFELYNKIEDYILYDIDKKEYFVSPELGISDLIADNKEVPFEELENCDEPIGTQLFTLRLDFYNRDYPFIVINDNLLIKGEPGKTHTDALYNFSKKQEDENFQFIADELENSFQREDTIDLMNETLDINKLCFGHVKDDMAFLDIVNGKPSSNIYNLVKKELNVKKVYISEDDYESKCLNTRVARLMRIYKDDNEQKI